MNKLLASIFFIFSNNLLAHGISDHAKTAMLEGGYLKYIWLGAEHMLTGYDHLLFLFGVLFFLKSFKDIVQFISAFTIGHCITLICATFLGISANYWLVDAVIALTVCYKGFDNLDGFTKYLGFKKSPNLIGMVFIFGLIHGFGLSTRLQELPLGPKGSSMLMKIISFNVGVELGQIVALTIMIGLLAGFRNTGAFKKFSKLANWLLIFAGFMLFLMQMHGYSHHDEELEHNSHETQQIEGIMPVLQHSDHPIPEMLEEPEQGHHGHDHDYEDHGHKHSPDGHSHRHER